MEKENFFKIILIILAVLTTGGMLGFMLSERAQAPVEQKETVQLVAKNSQTPSAEVTQSESQIPTGWKTYIGDLSGFSSRFAGKKISFNYPAGWGEAKAEKISEGTAFDGPNERIYDIWNISFSSYPLDGDENGASIKIVDSQNYATPNDVTFLRRIASSDAPVGENDLRALNKLGHGYGSTVFFGVNVANKYIPRDIATSDRQMKGLTFFMQDNQSLGIGLSYNATLLDQKSNLILGAQFYLTSKQQTQFENELNAIGNGNDKKSLAARDIWYKKWEDFINESYDSDPDYMNLVKDINLVMLSMKIQ